MTFTLHPQLAADTIPVGDLAVCRVLLMNDCRFPWLILVPRREGLRELFDLSAPDHAAVMTEVRDTCQTFSHITGAHKMNVAALGNMVPQLHIHVIARHTNDCAWPKPVWSASGQAAAYPGDKRLELLEKVQTGLKAGNITKM